MAFAYGFLTVMGLPFTPYSFLISSWNSLPKNSFPLSYVTCVGQGYLQNHSCLAMLATVSERLFGICCSSNQPVAGSIIGIALQTRSSFPFLQILYGPIRLIKILALGSDSASLGGMCPYFVALLLFIWQVEHVLICCLIWSLILGHQKC